MAQNRKKSHKFRRVGFLPRVIIQNWLINSEIIGGGYKGQALLTIVLLVNSNRGIAGRHYDSSEDAPMN